MGSIAEQRGRRKESISWKIEQCVIKFEQQRENRLGKKRSTDRSLVIWTILKYQTIMSLESLKERGERGHG